MQPQEATEVYLLKLWPWVEANKRKLIIGVGIVIVIALAVSFLSWQNERKEIASGEALTKVNVSSTRDQMVSDYMKVATENSSTSAGKRAALLAAMLMFDNGRYADAQAQFQSFLDTHPENAFAGTAALGVASSLDAQGKSDLALSAYQRAITILSDNIAGMCVAKLAVGRILESQSKANDALAAYADVMRADPGGLMGSEASLRSLELKTKSPSVSKPASSTTPFNLSQ